MKTKHFKTFLISTVLVFSLLFSIQIINNKYSVLRTDFLKTSKGRTQNFINSFIN